MVVLDESGLTNECGAFIALAAQVIVLKALDIPPVKSSQSIRQGGPFTGD